MRFTVELYGHCTCCGHELGVCAFTDGETLRREDFDQLGEKLLAQLPEEIFAFAAVGDEVKITRLSEATPALWNGRAMPVGERITLNDGDTVTLGDIEFSVGIEIEED